MKLRAAVATAKLDAEAFERILIQWEIQRAGQETDKDQIATITARRN